MRYYFTNDGTAADTYACDYAMAGSGNVTGAFTTIAKTNADRYLEVGFTSAAGTLAAGAGSEVKGRIYKSDWSNFTQTNDYSFNATAANYVDSATTTGYLAGALKWGTEP
jgi:xyloglucan-specific exo-beta-1,4-glucanase